jgi:hypothetical protein
MASKKGDFFSMTGNNFILISNSCICKTDVVNISPSEIKKTFKLLGDSNKTLKFAFSPGRGMVRLDKNGTVDSDNVLTELVSLPSRNESRLFKFFSDYGFLFPVGLNDYEAFEPESLFSMIDRIKAITHLLSALGEPKKDYIKILGLSLYLQLAEEIVLDLETAETEAARTCPHKIGQVIINASNLSETDDWFLAEETITVVDTILSPHYSLDVNEYNNIVGNLDADVSSMSISQIYKNVAVLYLNAPDLPREVRTAIDLLFHYQRSIGAIESIDATGTIHHVRENDARKKYLKEFNNAMGEATITFAKATIRDELDFNLLGIVPRYNTDNMAPAWQVEDLRTGLYMSIFYMQPETELYRECSNPNCNNSYLVKTTSSKRRYCSDSCRNATAQRSHRRKLKERKGQLR